MRMPAVLVVIASWLIFWTALCSPLIAPNTQYITHGFVLFAVVSFALTYFGFGVGSVGGPWRKIYLTRNGFLLLFLSCLTIAVAARLVDGFFLRPTGDFMSISSVREARQAGSNVFSVVAGVMAPVSLALYDRVASGRYIKNRALKFVIYCLLSFIALVSLVSGSRGGLLVVLIFLFARVLTVKRLVFVAPVLMVVFGAVFAYRFASISGLEDMSELAWRVGMHGYSAFVPMSKLSAELLTINGLRFYAFSLIQANQYFAHGIFEFAYIFRSAPIFEFDPSRVIPHLSKLYSFSSALERENLYYTAPGTYYIAFGVCSLLVAPLIGYVLGVCYRRGRTLGAGSKGVVLLGLFLTPFVNNIGSYDLHFALVAIIIASKIDVKCKVGRLPVGYIRSTATQKVGRGACPMAE